MARFDPVRKRARFKGAIFTDQQMLRIGNKLADSIRNRIHAGLDVWDNPAPPLAMNYRAIYTNNKLSHMTADRGYRAQKARKSPPPIRNWWYTGRTLRSLRVLSYSARKIVIGFTDAVANLRAAVNNRRHRQFGLSPKDRIVLTEAVASEHRVNWASQNPWEGSA